MILQLSASETGLSIVKRNIFTTSVACKRIYKYPILISNEVVQHPRQALDVEDEILNSLKEKLVYNSVVSARNSWVRWRVRRENCKQIYERRIAAAVPFSLKYAYDASQLDFDEYKNIYSTKPDDRENERILPGKESSSEPSNFPYSIVKNVDFLPATSHPDAEEPTEARFRSEKGINPRTGAKVWRSDYDIYEVDDADEIENSTSEYGSADPNVLPSKIACGGCGAHLHCQDISIPGFLPKELFLHCSEKDLRQTVCQRCNFLKLYNVALSVNVDPESYPRMLSSIRKEKALVIILVDMMDFPCSIWPNVLKIIGRNKPIILVGNKIDLIPGDSSGWLHHAKKVLLKSFPAPANVLHVALISAKTGFGVEELITKIQSLWQNAGDVYLVGCTNVGKSSLFNALLQSDFCKTEAIDLIQRATVAPWPGTTLNLLKFPILRMNAWRSFLRTSRLTQEHQSLVQERNLERMQADAFNQKISQLPKIEGLIGLSFNARRETASDKGNNFMVPTFAELQKENVKVFDPDSPKFCRSKWCYDTPGVVHNDQIINILTTEELTTMLPKSTIAPHMYSIYPEQSLLIGGLGRIDLVKCDAKMARLVVYASRKLPITVCYTEHVDEVYNTLLGTKYLGVPCGDAKRLQKWPPLKSVGDFEFEGKGLLTSLGDIVLSSAGWVSPVAAHSANFVIRPFTPDGRGIHFRDISLLRYTAKFRRRRVSNTPTYFMSHA